MISRFKHILSQLYSKKYKKPINGILYGGSRIFAVILHVTSAFTIIEDIDEDHRFYRTTITCVNVVILLLPN